MAEANVLICTVGGSHQPIVTAIMEISPIHVCFLCTDKDLVTGQSGSRVQVEGKGNVIKAHPGDDGPTLPNIAVQAGLDGERYGVRIVPSDDLDAVVSRSVEAIAELRQRFPDARIFADYTGGTKTMTAGLVIAALESPDVELRLVTGARGDLDKVHDGTERSIEATTEGLRLRRAMSPFLAAWERYDYCQAALGLTRLKPPRVGALRAEWQLARDLSASFDAWDRFDHRSAFESLNVYRPRIGAQLGLHLTFLEILTAEEGDRRREPAQLIDLWHNAGRRAAQGRYDDAVARGYRLLEWAAQWLLRTRAGLDTSDLPPERLPSGLRVSRDAAGRIQAGLLAAWELIAATVEGEPAAFARAECPRLQDYVSIRNRSILAHGFVPIDRSMWERFHEWMSERFLPFVLAQSQKDGLRFQPPQLPTSLAAAIK